MCSGCIAAIVWCPPCTLGQRQRGKRVNEREKSNQSWNRQNTIATARDHKYRNWWRHKRIRGLHTDKEVSTGITLGLLFTIMYRRVRTYNHIKMKRYRSTYSRYLPVVLLQIELWWFLSSHPASSYTLTQAVYSNSYRLHVCPGGRLNNVWLPLRSWQVWTKIIWNSGLSFWCSLVWLQLFMRYFSQWFTLVALCFMQLLSALFIIPILRSEIWIIYL